MVFELSVLGMHCDNCCRKVQTALSALAGVRHVDVRLDPESAEQIVSEVAERIGRVRVIGETERASIEEAIRNAGFSVPSD